jgi:hypothetical protein
MADRRVRIFVKKQIRIDHLSLQQRQMFKLGTVGLASRKDEISRGLNARGGAAKPLTRRYAIYKGKVSKLGGRGRNVRDLRLTGNMLREWSVRTVSNTKAFAGWSTRKGRIKARANNALEEFVAWSSNNTRDVVRAGNQILNETSRRLILEKALND